MKIAIFRTDTTIVQTDSYNSQEIGLARGLAEHGHSVDIYSLASGKTVESVSINAEPMVNFLYLPAFIFPVFDFPVYKNLKKILASNQYDLVQVNEEGSFASFYIGYHCKKRNIPFCLYQGMYSNLSGRARALYESAHHRLIRPWLSRNALAVFSKTSQAREFMTDKGYRGVKIVGVGLDDKPFNNADDISWKAELGIKSNHSLILYVGSLEKRRNPDFLLDVASRLNDSTHMLIVGTGPMYDQLSDRITTEELKNVRLLGKIPQSKLPSLYKQSSVLLLPSSYEIFGMVVLEALWFGVPVLSTRTAGPTDIISEYIFGEIVESLDRESWVNAIERRLSKVHDEERRLELQELARGRFNWTAIGGNYLSELKKHDSC